MNNKHNYADFVGMSLTSNDEFEPYGYEPELQLATYEFETPQEKRIENMLLNHSKYHIYCE